MAQNPTFIANFAIFRRDLTGNLVQEYAPNTAEYTYVASAVNLAREFLSTQYARAAMVNVATDFDRTNNNAWYYPRLNNNAAAAAARVQTFLSRMRASFPFIIIDELITNPDIFGFHPRGQWNTSQEFDPRRQSICINAKRVRDMVAAANSGSPNFRLFQFQLAHIFIHEVGGHMLITYLGINSPTPDYMGNPLYPVMNTPEAGRYLELFLFNGAMEFYRDHNQNDRQPGIPHILRVNGLARRISSTTIDNFVRYQFAFPYGSTGQDVHMNQMQSLGHPAATGPPVIPPGPQFMAQALQGYRISVHQLRAVPFNPAIRVQAV